MSNPAAWKLQPETVEVKTRVVHGLTNIFLAKLQGPILPRRSRDCINPKHASEG